MKQTKLRAVKDVANALLQLDPHMTKFSPIVISHPFSSSGITAIMKNGETTMLNIAESKEDLKEWRKAMQYQINHVSDPFEIYMMVNTPYALTFLKLAKPYLSERDFSTILASAWIQTEAPNQDIDVSKSQLLSMFKVADPSVLMDEDELQQWRDLDDEITVYRGVTPYNEKNIRALSWTLDRETAEWFAHRFDEDGTVYQARIEKEHVYAIFNGRNESEVIVDPKHLTDITEAMDLEPQFELSM